MSVLEKLVGLRRVAALSGGADASWEKLQNDPADVAEVQPKPSGGYRKSCPNGRNCRACGVAVHKAREWLCGDSGGLEVSDVQAWAALEQHESN